MPVGPDITTGRRSGRRFPRHGTVRSRRRVRRRVRCARYVQRSAARITRRSRWSRAASSPWVRA